MVSQDILELDPKEKVLTQLQRHPISVVAIYLGAGIGITACLLLLFLGVRYSGNLSISIPDSIYIILFSGTMILIAVFGYIAAYIDRSNVFVVTDENIIQVLQFSLFNRQVSQLNLAKIQDVSVDQVGIFQTFFKYGTLEIETAGEASNFKFQYTPDPNTVAKTIIEAHEEYIKGTHRGSRSI